MTLISGLKLGRYEIKSPLGAGGMGEVYLARDTRLDRTVAIKILPKHLTEKPQAKQRFEREARVISSLQHPNICTLYDVGLQGGTDFLVMEFLDGETLGHRLARGSLRSEQMLKIGIEICEGLENAHQCGVVHRDLKPGNIMLTKTGAKLLDFGLAQRLEVAPAASLTSLPTSTKALNVEPKNPLTAEDAIVGTFQYMSPEQLQGKEADERTDIFALGAVLFEMATGKRAFDGQTQASVIAAVLEREPPPVSSLQPNSPPSLDQVVRSCLAKNPDQRWQAVRDVKLQLQWIAADVRPAAPRRKPFSILAWGFAACVLVAIAFGSGLLLRVSQSEKTVRSSLLPPQSSSFLPFNFAISPDGSRLAFVALDPNGKTALWVRSLSSATAQQLGDTDGAEFPFWSPDGRSIGFFAGGRLKTVNLAGGSMQTLCDVQIPFGATWNRDGTIVFSPTLFGPLNRVQASGGTSAVATRILRQGSVQAHRWPYFLPDGKHFLYLAQWSTPADVVGDGVYAGSLDSGEAKLISSEITGNVVYASGYLLYVRDRRIMAQPFDPDRLQTTGSPVPVSEQELEQHPILFMAGLSSLTVRVSCLSVGGRLPSRLQWFDARGKELSEFPELGTRTQRSLPMAAFSLFRPTTNGTENISFAPTIWSAGSVRGLAMVAMNIHPCGRVTVSGSSIIRGPSALMFTRCLPMGRGPRRFSWNGKVSGVPNDWSPDGHLVFMAFSKEHPVPSLAVYSAGDKQVTEFRAPRSRGKFSPDGKWIAYAGAGIFVESFPGPGTRIQLADRGAQPLWSHDGRQIFCIEPDRKLMAVSFDPEKKAASRPRVLFQTRIAVTQLSGWQYAVAPDGRFLINSLPSDHSSPLRW